MQIDPLRLKHLEVIESYAERLLELWIGTPFSEVDEKELGVVVEKFMEYMQQGREN